MYRDVPLHRYIILISSYYVILQASYLVTMGYHYIGAQATINVWNPVVDLPDDFTTAQIWLKTGAANSSDFESVEAGWVVGSPTKTHKL